MLARLDHTFIERCNILNSIVTTHLVLACAWAFIFFAWLVHALCINKAHTFTVQKVLIFIPSCKLIECLVNFIFYNACPWLEAYEPSVKYIENFRAVLITIVYATLLGILYLISRGWQTLIFKLTRELITKFCILMGIVIICFALYFSTSDFSGSNQFMKVSFYHLIMQFRL